MDAELLARIGVAADEAFAGSGIFLAYAHGSRVRGTARPDSDLDIGYYRTDGTARFGRMPIADEMVLEDRLSRLIGLEVDLRNLGEAPLEFRGRVLEEGVRIYCSDEQARVAVESDLLSRYHDYKAEFAAFHEQRLKAFAGKD